MRKQTTGRSQCKLKRMAEVGLLLEPVQGKELSEKGDANFFHTILQNFDQHRDKQVFGWLSEECKVVKSYTYGELDSRTQEFASGLLNTVQEKQHSRKTVMLCYTHGPEFIVAFLGCLRAGLIPGEYLMLCDVNWSRMHSTASVCKLSFVSVPMKWTHVAWTRHLDF